MSNSEYLQFSDVPAYFEKLTGKTPSIHTLKRWINKGYRGVKLRTFGPVQFRSVTTEAIDQFMRDCEAVKHCHEKRAEILARVPGEFGEVTEEDLAKLRKLGIKSIPEA